MKLWNVCAIPVMLGVFGVMVSAAEAPPADYQAAMKSLGAFAGGAPKAVAAEDFDTVTKLADSAKNAFAVVEAYWTKKADSAAVGMAQEGAKAAADLGVTAGLRSKEGAEYSVKQITGLCGGCHSAHREKAADGTFQIK